MAAYFLVVLAYFINGNACEDIDGAERRAHIIVQIARKPRPYFFNPHQLPYAHAMQLVCNKAKGKHYQRYESPRFPERRMYYNSQRSGLLRKMSFLVLCSYAKGVSARRQ